MEIASLSQWSSFTFWWHPQEFCQHSLLLQTLRQFWHFSFPGESPEWLLLFLAADLGLHEQRHTEATPVLTILSSTWQSISPRSPPQHFMATMWSTLEKGTKWIKTFPMPVCSWKQNQHPDLAPRDPGSVPAPAAQTPVLAHPGLPRCASGAHWTPSTRGRGVFPLLSQPKVLISNCSPGHSGFQDLHNLNVTWIFRLDIFFWI